MSKYSAAVAALLCVSLLEARQDKLSCGTHPDRWREEAQLHENAAQFGIKRLRKAGTARLMGEREVEGKTVRADSGSIAVLDDSDGVVSRRNAFNLDKKTIRFTPLTSGYRYLVGDDSFDAAAASAGSPVTGLGDDDARQVTLPFAFSYFGTRYDSVFVNSDGNLTFTAGDDTSSDRSLGRMTSGPPRIAALFRDLDPSRGTGGVKTTSSADAFVVTWDKVPEYRDIGTGQTQTFQIRLYPDGRIEIAYSDVNTAEAVVGVAPGTLQGATSVVSFLNSPAGEGAAAITERFSASEKVDIFSAAQKFYLNHEDTYDYLVFFNTLGIAADDGAVAYEVTVRNNRAGYGDAKVDIGQETGSKKRLQALLNMGPLSQYPKDPDARVAARLSVGDTPITTIGHEAGHLFLALASVRNPDNPNARPMLGGQASAHWNFAFNSEASLLEGNRIQDNGPNASPRFLTTATVQGYSPLDQYLMGFRPSQEVPDTFLVVNPQGSGARGLPKVGVAFDGDRRDIRIDEVIAAEGRRTPDHTVSQRRFRFAFVLITAAGADPTPEVLSQVDTYRQKFEQFFTTASSDRAFADTSLKPTLSLSAYPAAGILTGSAAPVILSLAAPASSPLTILLRSKDGNVQVPASVVIPAGATSATFQVTGIRPGTDEISAEPANSDYSPVWARLQVSNPDAVRVVISSGDKQPATSGVALKNPVTVRVTDVNELPYPGVPVTFSVAGGGSVDRSSTLTDDNGTATVRWTPGSGPANILQASVAGTAGATAAALGRPFVTGANIVNAASWAAGLTPGGLATVFGANLSGNSTEVLVNGTTARIVFAGIGQVNFLVPSAVTPGTASLQVRTEIGVSEAVQVPVAAIQPGIFFEPAGGYGAVLTGGTTQWTQSAPVARGGTIEIYGTGFGAVQPLPDGLSGTIAPTQVSVAGVAADVLFSGLAPGFLGLYQINARIPDSAPSGTQPLVVTAAGLPANAVKIAIR